MEKIEISTPRLYNPGDGFLPYGRQTVDETDVAAVVETLHGNWLTQGPQVEEFEDALSTILGARHVISCSSGTAALHLAISAAEIGFGDSVIVPANTFLATANMVRTVGAEVIFADVDSASGLMTVDHATAAMQSAEGANIKAIIPVHYAGQCTAPLALNELANTHGLTIIEDACHALGTTYKANNETHQIGGCAHSTIATFSFHPVKTIAMGEGGAVATNDERTAIRMREFRNHGMVRDPQRFIDISGSQDNAGVSKRWYYEMHELGFNYRLSSLHCALGSSQLTKLDGFIARRRELVDIYDQLLAPFAPIIQKPARIADCTPAWHLYAPRFDFTALGISRNALMTSLFDAGIGTQVHYIPVPSQPYYCKRYGVPDLPGAEAHYAGSLSLPLFPAMQDRDVERVVHAISHATGLQQA